MTDLPYRPCAGVILMNRDGRVFVGQRIDSTLEAWQLPQGGIDPGEDAETAALRELFEETGVTADKVELIARAPREQLLELLARSFHAAVQARNISGYVLSRHEEEVFIAALLYNVGELAFWGCGGGP